MSLNDNGWGKPPNSGENGSKGDKGSGNDGPPDLEELWRDLNQRLAALFGVNKNGKIGNLPPVSGKPANLGGLLIGVVVLFLALWAGSGFYIVDASERGVVFQFGRYHETTQPGLRWHLPWPVQSREVVNLSAVRTVEIGYSGNVKEKVLKESLMLTDDENIVSVQFAVQFLLKDPVAYILNNRSPDDSVKQTAETAIREVVGKSKMDFVLNEGRSRIADDTIKLMQEILDRYKTGVQVTAVTMQGVQPPEQVQAAFDDANRASQDKERQKNDALAYANDVIPKASGTASRLSQEAEGYRSRVVATAEGDAARFSQLLPEYAKAPAVTRTRMYLETMQQVYANASKVVVDTKGSGNLLNLSLDKLMQATAANGQSSADAGQAKAPLDTVVVTATEKKSGDLSSRDRSDR